MFDRVTGEKSSSGHLPECFSNALFKVSCWFSILPKLESTVDLVPSQLNIDRVSIVNRNKSTKPNALQPTAVPTIIEQFYYIATGSSVSLNENFSGTKRFTAIRNNRTV